MSLLCVIPISMLSDRLKRRKAALVAMASMIVIGIGLLSVVNGGWVWAAVAIAGFVRDGFMAIFMAIIVETKGVSAKASGTAIGLVMIFSGLGNLTAPPMGNNLAALNPATPFALWAGFAVVGLFALLFLRENKNPQPARSS
jgi:MFS family permease